MRTRLFLDTEFTGLHQATQLISLALVSESSSAFYAELTDYAPTQLSDWHQQNVVPNLLLTSPRSVPLPASTKTVLGDKATVRAALTEWLAPLGPVEIWADVLAWDWVLFCELFGGSFGLPQNVFYIPFDLGTLFYLTGAPDVSRESFAYPDATALATAEAAWGGAGSPKHNALWDAQVSQTCFERLRGMVAGLSVK